MVDKYCMSLEENIAYAKRNIVDLIYKSARLEGIAITFPETNEIYEGRNIANLSVDDVVKVNNLKHCWRFVLDNLECDLDLRYIKQVNGIIQKDLHPQYGQIRNSVVGIGGTSWKPDIPDEDNLKMRLGEIITSTRSNVEKGIDLLLFIMRSQMFHDGNKRTAQLIANFWMIKNGCGILAVPVELQKDFLEYLITYYETNENKQIKDFLYTHCVDGYSSVPNYTISKSR